MVLITI